MLKSKSILVKKICISFFILLFIFCALLFSSFNYHKSEAITKCSYYTIDSTVKVKQDDESYSQNGNDSFAIDMVRNEYESQQLVIHATEDVSSFYLYSSDLKNGNCVLSKNDIDIYLEKYTYVSEDLKFGYEEGYYPDALLPIETANEYSELSIKKDENAVLWVTFYSQKTLMSGTYTGEFVLDVDGVKESISVSVTVENYTLTDDVNANTAFSNRYYENAYAEFDCTNSMNEYLYEFLLDYRITMGNLPVQTLTGDEMVYYVEKYYDQISTFMIMNSNYDIRGEFEINVSHTKEIVLALASVSSPEKNILGKGYFYLIDEPNLDYADKIRGCINLINQLNGVLKDCVIEIRNDTSGKYDSFKRMSDWENIIMEIPNIIPINQKEYVDLSRYVGENISSLDELRAEFFSLANTLCPQWDFYEDATRNKFIELCEYFGCDIWWYGCGIPNAPYATYHIADDNLLSSRSITWLQKKYNVLGNLYWDVAGYLNASTYRGIDVYTNPYILKNYPAGDGILIYPGAAYGIYGPLPSMRLMSIRDGNEEYEMLLDAEERISELSEEYRVTLDATSVLDRLYERLYYSGSSMYLDFEAGLEFSQLRESLFNIIVTDRNETGFIIDSYNVIGEELLCTFYVKDGYEVYIDGNKITPYEDNHYRFCGVSNNGSFISFIIKDANGFEYKYYEYIKVITNVINSFNYNSNNDIKGLTVTDNSTYDVNSNQDYVIEGNSLHFNMSSVITGSISKDLKFKPEIRFAIKDLSGNINIAEAITLSVNIYNDGEACNITFRIYSGLKYQDYTMVTLERGWNTLTIPLSTVSFAEIDNADTISFLFENAGTKDNPTKYDLYFDNMTIVN